MPKGVYNRPKRRKIRKLCECGCGRLAKYGKRYIIGHSRRGTHHSTSKETRKKIGDAHRGKHPSEETRERMSIAHIGKHPSKESDEKRVESRRNNGKPWTSEETKKKIRDGNRGKHRSEETRKKNRIAQLKIWEDPVFRKNTLATISKGLHLRPTKSEKVLIELLDKILPGEYKYVGDGKVIIGDKNPDFIAINGQKKIIELFGDYWHSEKMTRRTKVEEENRIINHYSKYGYQTLIIWGNKLKNLNTLKNRIVEFNSK